MKISPIFSAPPATIGMFGY